MTIDGAAHYGLLERLDSNVVVAPVAKDLELDRGVPERTVAAPPLGVRPLMFGPEDAPLYGCYHAAQAPPRGMGVLICQPVGHEFIRCHRCLRNLAHKLAAAGIPALRFDYLGCGDSAGDDEDVSLPAWLASIALAAAKLQRRADVPRLVVVGLRLGAALAATAAAEGMLAADAVVLWQPFIDGRMFLHDMRAAHQRHAVRVAKEFGPLPPGADAELLGCRRPQELISELQQLNLLRLSGPPAPHVLLVDNDESSSAQPLAQHLSALGSAVETAHVPEQGVWGAEPDVAALPHASLQRIVTWIDRRVP